MASYSRLGFNTMVWNDCCKPGLLDVNADAAITDEGEIQENTGIRNTESGIQKKSTIPWWLIIAGGYLLYKEGTGL